MKGGLSMLRGNGTKRRRAWLAGLAVTAALAVAGCSSASTQAPGPVVEPSGTSSANAAALENPNLDLGTPLGTKPATDFKLVNQFGQPMSLSQFRGKVVLLSFDDSQCTTICPLTTQSMVLAKELLGKAGSSVQLLGVDANPDAVSVSNVMAYSRVHGMVNQWDFLTGTLPQLKSVWKSYGIAVQVESGLIDHTPALYVIDQQGRLRKVYLTQMAYSSVTQSAQVLAQEVSSLLPGHPKLSSIQSLAAISPQDPTAAISLPAAGGNGTVTLGPGKARLVVFFATWLRETSNLNAELTGLNAYAKAAPGKHLPALTAVDETASEPSVAAVTSYLKKLGTLDYPVALDKTGRVADGYGVQNQPWLVLVNQAGKVTWQHDGWVSLPALEKAAAAVK
ncbi:MAG TPA: SCO family protein [Trebonia sp.]|nr:SCO family protein [Trebonia sp.]